MKKKSKIKASKKNRAADHPDNDGGKADQPAASPPKRRQSKIDYETFARVWTESDTVPEAAEKLGIAVKPCCAIAGRLRKKGLKLKMFPRRGVQKIDVDHINDVIASLDETKTKKRK